MKGRTSRYKGRNLRIHCKQRRKYFTRRLYYDRRNVFAETWGALQNGACHRPGALEAEEHGGQADLALPG
ncbi:hypothetical protein AGOR_G00214570 [Albula goreensis]|uniref:Uncharacterized protein n=1 Tax=Albula goreensis TaxID=1534307 RepID=A0A8T3CIF6_9TELE|nr:hypothetical protein AGOR_G00214570 [Albula goreensis]